MKKIILFLMAFLLAGCGINKTAPSTNTITPVADTSSSSNYQLSDVTVKTQQTMNASPSSDIAAEKIVATISTNKGTMKVVLFPKIAPKTVANFVELAKGTKINPNTNKKVSEKPFYDGLTFHRIINGFMIQGGDPNGTGTGGPGYKFEDEPVTEEYSKGTIAMANSGPNTNGSQFFIMHKDYPLPPQYTIFGRIESTDTQSMATVDAIANVETNSSDAPLEKVVISSIKIEE